MKFGSSRQEITFERCWDLGAETLSWSPVPLHPKPFFRTSTEIHCRAELLGYRQSNEGLSAPQASKGIPVLLAALGMRHAQAMR